MSTNVKKNVFYSAALAISLYLFPLLTFPYVTRVLGVDKLGICNYANGIIEYFCIFSMMGMSAMGIREIARSKHDKEKLAKSFSSLIVLNLVTTFAAIVVLIILVYVLPQFREYKILIYIGIPKILFNTLLIEWFYKGLEDFKYITLRSIIVRCLYVIAVFVLVKSPEDYILFFALSIFMVVLNAIINIVYSRKFVHFTLLSLSIREYAKPFFKLGAYQLLTYMYTSFNVVFLGMVSGTTEVGYYTTAVKLYSVLIALFSAFTGALMPRMSVYIESGNYEKFYYFVNHTISVLLLFSIPIIITAEIFSPEVIKLIAGAGYEGAITPMRIVLPLLIVIGLEQVLIAQILTPFRKDNAILTNSIIGAIVGVIANIVFVPLLGSVGAAITWVVSEMSVLLAAQYFLHKDSIYNIKVIIIVRYVLYSIPVVLLVYFVRNLCKDNFVFLLLAMGICFVMSYIYFFSVEIAFYNNPLLISYKEKMKTKLHL